MQACCIIIPCYNEAMRLDRAGIEKYLTGEPGTVLVFVNDGSTDRTSKILHDIRDRHPDRLFVFDLESNSGKANAIRQGMLFALREIKPVFIGYMDADLSAPFGEMDRMFTFLVQQKIISVIFGSRIKRMGSWIERTPGRHYFGRILATGISFVLNLPVYDSQCGAKVMTSAKATELFREDFVTSWLFDVELLCRHRVSYGKRRTLQEVYEYPLSVWTETRGSKIRFLHILAMPFDLLKIYFYYMKKCIGNTNSVLSRE